MAICENIQQIQSEIGNAQLVVVSKYRSLAELQEVYDCGHLNLGENRVQELVQKHEALPKNIRWHLIGHLQTNKVKQIVPFVQLIHSVDSFKLLRKINEEASKIDRVMDVLLQVHIAQEEHKYGFQPTDINALLCSDEVQNMQHINCIGLMGMATNTKDTDQIEKEFKSLHELFTSLQARHGLTELSMGMSGDYRIAVECGSTMLRIGSKVFE